MAQPTLNVRSSKDPDHICYTSACCWDPSQYKIPSTKSKDPFILDPPNTEPRVFYTVIGTILVMVPITAVGFLVWRFFGWI